MLNIAVLSDIHSNYVALRECMDYAIHTGIDTFIFLGDYLGDLAYPSKTMDILHSVREKYTCYFIRGNKEDYWINYEKESKGWSEYSSTTGCLYYTYHNLTHKDLEFFKSLPIKEELEFAGLNDKAPYWCKVSEKMLRTGEISHGTVLKRAMTICKEKFGECNWPNIPEECWAQATNELIKG